MLNFRMHRNRWTFLNESPVAQEITSRINQLDYIKLKCLCTTKETTSRVNVHEVVHLCNWLISGEVWSTNNTDANNININDTVDRIIIRNNKLHTSSMHSMIPCV